MFFDAREAKLLQPKKYLSVAGCPGLRLIASSSVKTWTYRYKSLDGGLKQIKLGHWPDLPVQAAVAAWLAHRTKKAEGIDPVSERKAKKQAEKNIAQSAPTVRDIVEQYVTNHLQVNRKPAGALAAGRALHSLLESNSEFASKPAHLVTRAEAHAILTARKNTPMAAQKLRSLLGSAWYEAQDAGVLPQDTANFWREVLKKALRSKGKIIGGKHEGRKKRTLHVDEIAQLLAWLPNMHLLGRDVTQMYLWTCARGVEITGIRPEHVKIEKSGWWWTVPKNLTKDARFENAVDFRVPLIGRALEIVQRRLKTVGESGWLFEDARGEQYNQHDFSTYIYNLQPYSVKVVRRQGQGQVLPVTHWTPHNLRGSVRTVLKNLGCIDEYAEAILGHMPPEIVATYSAYSYDTERLFWLQRLSAYLETLTPTTGLPARP